MRPPEPEVTDDRVAKAVGSRLMALKLQALDVAVVRGGQVQVRFKSGREAVQFKRALATIPGFALRLPDDRPSGPSPNQPPSPGDERLRTQDGGYIWIKPGALVTGEMVTKATVGFDQQLEEPIILFELTDEGTKLFAAATSSNIGKRISLVVDGVTMVSPVVQSPITGGRGQITCVCNIEAASALVESMLGHQDDLPLKIADQQPNH